jgi:hypothetical protein
LIYCTYAVTVPAMHNVKRQKRKGGDIWSEVWRPLGVVRTIKAGNWLMLLEHW